MPAILGGWAARRGLTILEFLKSRDGSEFVSCFLSITLRDNRNIYWSLPLVPGTELLKPL